MIYIQEKVELKNDAGTVCTMNLHTASQQRWTSGGKKVEQQPQGYFLEPFVDAQAKMPYHYHYY